jgi:hypothetical protein
MSPKLGFSLDRIVINPVAVYEDLPKDEVKEQINLRPKKKKLVFMESLTLTQVILHRQCYLIDLLQVLQTSN